MVGEFGPPEIVIVALPAGWPAHVAALTAIVPVGRAMPTLVVGEVVKVWLVSVVVCPFFAPPGCSRRRPERC